MTSADLTRRSWLKLACRTALASSSLGIAQRSLAAARVPQLTPVKDFKDMYLIAVSPDSKKLCISPFRRRKSARIVATGTWEELASLRTRVWPQNGSFFLDSQRCYVETGWDSSSRSWHGFVMSLDGESEHAVLEERVEAGVALTCWALYDDYLLARESVVIGERSESLLKLELPSLQKVLRVPFHPPEVSSNRVTSTGVHITTDRKKLFCGVSGSLVCRITEDLTVQWVRPIEERFQFAPFFLASTTTGNVVASTNLESRIQSESDRAEVGLYDGSNGEKIGSVPVKGSPAIALSPNGQMLAVGNTEWSGGPKPEAAINLFQVPTGKFLTRVVHSETSGRNTLAAMFASNSIHFTPDGRYLIVSVNNRIRVWELG